MVTTRYSGMRIFQYWSLGMPSRHARAKNAPNKPTRFAPVSCALALSATRLYHGGCISVNVYIIMACSFILADVFSVDLRRSGNQLLGNHRKLCDALTKPSNCSLQSFFHTHFALPSKDLFCL